MHLANVYHVNSMMWMDMLRVALVVSCFYFYFPLCNAHKTRREFLKKESEILSRYPGQDDYISPTTRVLAVAGETANLPCHVSSTTPDDPAVLVLWYKNGVVKPIYSYDSRKGIAMHWKNPLHISNRANYDPTRGELFIQKIKPEDKGIYRCRVHFKTNPTLSYGTNLTIIIPPSRVTILAPSGIEAGKTVGPFQEGDSLRLRCEAMGGNPTPEVSWWEGAHLLDKTDEITTAHQVANILLLESLSREDLDRVLTCTASNTNLSAPLKTSVSIDMNFPPKRVRILSSLDPLSAGRRYEVTCQSSGSKPTSKVKWYIKSPSQSSFASQTSEEGNITTSKLQFTPQIDDNGKDLQCIGTSPALPRFPVIDTWKLNVFFPPEAKIRAGSSLNLEQIEENDDVYFECEIKANPPVYKIIWYHQGVELRHNVSQGIIISNQSLVLQKVRKSATGFYSCKASNIEGDGSSKSLELTVKFSPVCNERQTLFYGAAPNEKVDIPCLVEAHPPPQYFTWTFNNSGESVDIADDRVQMDGYQATVSYTPRTELDYGTLLCRATNLVGTQNNPCIFHVFPAGRPDPVHNCSQFNFSESSIHIRCHPGFDGGLPQRFIFEVLDSRNRLITNQTRKVALFTHTGISSAKTYEVIVRSVNGKGSSGGYSIKVYTLKDNAEKRTAAIKPAPSGEGDGDPLLPLLTPILAITLGVAIGMVSVIIIIVSVVRIRKRRVTLNARGQSQSSEEDQVRAKSPKELMQSEALPHGNDRVKGTSTQELLQKSSPQSSEEGGNPDLIPRKSVEGTFWNQCLDTNVTPSKNVQNRSSSMHPSYMANRLDSKGHYFNDRSMGLPSSYHLRGSQQNLSNKETIHEKHLKLESGTLPRRTNSKNNEDPQIPPMWYGTKYLEGEVSPSETYRPSSTTGTLPWSNASYQTKLRLGKELETIEPLLSQQRESSV